MAGEGSLDPLGLAPLADELAELLVPHVRARMSRVRFVTAMAVGAVVAEGFIDQVAGDEISSPSICFEWLTIEAFVRRIADEDWTRNIPGSRKARSVVNGGGRLAAGNYLKTPTVFGFNGIYRPLASSLGIVDQELLPGERCGALVTAWERDQGVDGFFDATPGSPGATFRRQLGRAMDDILAAGRCDVSPSAHVLGTLARTLHPDRAGRREREVLRAGLLDAAYPERAELATKVTAADDGSERDLLEWITRGASTGLADRARAIASYERFAVLLVGVFDAVRHASTNLGLQPLELTKLSELPLVEQAAVELPSAYAKAVDCLSVFDLDGRMAAEFGLFGEGHPPAHLAETVIAFHDDRQRRKPPAGKRSWFDRIGPGVVLRQPYLLGQPPALAEQYLHPFRVIALRGFMDEVA